MMAATAVMVVESARVAKQGGGARRRRRTWMMKRTRGGWENTAVARGLNMPEGIGRRRLKCSLSFNLLCLFFMF